MNYEEATRYLISLGNEVRASASDSIHAYKLGLDNVTELLAELGRPQNAYPSVLIAGTNGKGSVAAMLDAVLQSAAGNVSGFRTGLYTSPHLVEINERIRLGGTPIPPDEFGELFTFLRAQIERLLASGKLRFHPTYFECLTAMAMEYFHRNKCSLAVFEVGMGGRLDATNTATPRLGVITEIDFDHERFLGHTIESIASEKAGIIKPGMVVVIAASRPDAAKVIRERAMEQQARLLEVQEQYLAESLTSHDGSYTFQVRDLSGWSLPVGLSLRGMHQVQNSLAAVAAARELQTMGFPISDGDIQRGLAAAIWPGRLELLHDKPSVYLDGAHNSSGARALARFWEDHFRFRRLILIYGAMRDKAVPEMAEILFPRASAVILTRPEQYRSAAAETIRELTGHLNANIICRSDPMDALETALNMASADDAIFVAGSLYLVGDIKRRWRTRANGSASSGTPRESGHHLVSR